MTIIMKCIPHNAAHLEHQILQEIDKQFDFIELMLK